MYSCNSAPTQIARYCVAIIHVGQDWKIHMLRSGTMATISGSARWAQNVMPRSGDNGASPCDGAWGDQPSHIVVFWVVADVADIQDHLDFSEIFPPVRRALGFSADFAGLVNDRRRAIAGILDDLALLHENERWTVVMAVPRNDAAWFDHQLAKTQLAASDLRLFFAEIDRAERGVGDADSFKVDRLTRIRHSLVGRAFASSGIECKARGSHKGRGSDSVEQAFAD